MVQPRAAALRFETALRAAALRLPDVEEGVACEGTALESRTFKVNNKAFLFVRRANVMLRLEDSADEARRLASQDDRYRIGAGGWVTVTSGADKTPPLVMIKRWIAESYHLYTVHGKPAAKKKRAATRK